MRRAFLLALVPLLVACSGAHTPTVSAGQSQVDVSSPSMVAFKKHTQVPACPTSSAGPMSGGLPSVTLPCLGGGRPVHMAGLRGPMIVNFWASWCHTCRTEMPALAAYARSHPQVKILGVDYVDTQPGAALELAQQSKVGYPLVADPAGALDHASPLPHIGGLPFNAFVAADGKVVHVMAGAMTNQDDVAKAVHDYLGVSG
jgi:thiol-disulfide isomerase/thioredoxin